MSTPEPTPYPCPGCMTPVPFEGQPCSDCANTERDAGDEDMPDDVRIESLEHRIAGMIADACLALGIEPAGGAWRCEGCGEYTTPDRSMGHERAVDEQCGPISIEGGNDSEQWAGVLETIRLQCGDSWRLSLRIVEMAGEVCAALGINAPGEDAVANWEQVLEAVRAKRSAVEPIGWVILDRNGEPYRAGSRPDDTVLFWSAASGAPTVVADALSELTESGYFAPRQPFRAVPVGPVQELKPYGWGMIDSAGVPAPGTIAGARRDTSAEAPRFSVKGAHRPVELFYLPSPPDRPAEAAEPALAGTESADGRWKKCLCGGNLMPGPFVLCDRCGQPEADRT